MKRGLLIFALILSLINTFVYADTIDSMSTYIKNGEIIPFADFLPDDDFKKIQPLDEQYNEYTDYAYGYSLKYPNHMNVDVSLSSVRTIIYDKDTRIEIYYDNFAGTHASTKAYINYSNQFMKNDKDHFKEFEGNITINGLNAHILKWSREKLYRVKDDKNFYMSAEIAKNGHEVYTIFIKSAKAFENAEIYMDIINSFQVVDRRGVPKSTARFVNKEKKLNEETEAFYKKYFLEAEDIKWGIFEYSAPKSFDFLHSLEKRVDYTFDFLVLYQSLSSSGFPMEEMKNAYENNRYVELTLQTMYLDGRDNSSVIYDILKGQYDPYFHQYAQKIKEFGHPVLFRLNNEMNGDWCPYSNYHTSKDTELFNHLWRYIYGIFEENGVDNVLWVWNPHDGSFPDFKWNHYLTYYPGDEYVDIIGLTGYNAGTYYPGEKWRSFREIYTPLYNEYMAHFEQPFMITEFGSNSVGGDKIMWIHEMFDLMKTMKNIKVAIWWNGIDWDKHMQPARIYRLDESDTMLRTFEYRLKEYKK